MTKRRIKEWYEHFDGDVFVSVSGGKDSQVLAHIVKGMYPDVPCVFVNTGLEYDSVRKKGEELADVVIRPEMTFVDVLKKYGYPIFSKETADCISGARKYIEELTRRSEYEASLTDRQTDRQTVREIPYAQAMADLLGIERRAKKENKLYKQLKMGTIPSATVRTKQMCGVYPHKENNEETNEYSKMYDKSRYLFALEAPFRISNRCCYAMKKKTSKSYEKREERKPIIGTMASESRLRKSRWIKAGCNAFDGSSPSSKPLSFWTENDILLYIKTNEIKMADVYGDVAYQDQDGMYYENPLFDDSMELTTTGVRRTGCVFCMFGITQDTDRFLKLKEIEPKKYDYVMRGGCFDEEGMWVPGYDENGVFGLGYRFVIDWLNEHGNLNIKY